MFGNATNGSQSYSGPVTSPTTNTNGINDDIPSAQTSDNQTNNDPNSVFPATTSNDPFGTAPIINDPSAVASPQSYQTSKPAHAQQTGDDLIGIKQQALEELSPLVKHLNQTPEEKYKTTMMMIQATDNHSLIPEAYASAKLIKDDKARAQALLDIINEINYFTQNSEE